MSRIDMTSRDLSFSDINIGDVASFCRTWGEREVQSFADLSGDMNPLHMDESYAGTTIFKHRLVHGMLVGSMCSALVGMYLPGKRCLYLKQDLSFKKPVFVGDTTEIIGTVISKSESTKIVSILIRIKKGEDIVIEGNAHVQVL